MTLLIDIRAPQWMHDQALRDLLAPHLPGVEILCGPPTKPLPSVLAVATNQLQPDVAPNRSLPVHHQTGLPSTGSTQVTMQQLQAAPVTSHPSQASTEA